MVEWGYDERNEQGGNGAEKSAYLSLAFAWKFNLTAIDAVLPVIETALVPYGVRPHWGKYEKLEAKDFLGTYPRLADFKWDLKKLPKFL